MLLRRSFLVLGLLSLCACGKEVGRVPFTSEGSGETIAKAQAGEVAFWTDIDMEWEGDAILTYRIELLQDGVRVAEVECNPLAHMRGKVAWTETNIGSSHSRRGSGKMPCSASLTRGGPTTVKATLAFGRRPASFTIRKIDLVVKQ